MFIEQAQKWELHNFDIQVHKIQEDLNQNIAKF